MKTFKIESIEYFTVEEIKTSYDYYQVVASMANSVIARVKEALEYDDLGFDLDSIEEFINDSALHETIDQSDYIIYSQYHLPIIQHSNIQHSNYNKYMIDNDCLEEALKTGGLSGLHSAVAFWALYADIQDKLNDHLNDIDFDVE